MEYKLSQKAYEVNLNKIDEGYLYDEIICYAENINKAKVKFLKENIDLYLSSTSEEVTYITIPVIRCKQADKFHFEDKELTLSQIENILQERKRINELYDLLNDQSFQFCYIRKGGYYRPNYCGYTEYQHLAGVYQKEDAVRHAISCDALTIIPIDIKEHNKMIQYNIEDLKSRIIKL